MAPQMPALISVEWVIWSPYSSKIHNIFEKYELDRGVTGCIEVLKVKVGLFLIF